MFADLERFVAAHRPCGELTSEVGKPAAGYALRVACACGAAFERWVMPETAEPDLLYSRLQTFPN